MGIQGLLPMLKEATDRVHLSKYKGKTLGVDAYVWLHRGAYGCAEALALGQYTDAYVRFAMGKVHMLKYHGITPYIVFDGDRLPAKAGTEHERRQKREESRSQARRLVEAGKRSAAREFFVRSIDVTPAMAFQLIKALRQANIDYLVAPYEADAQLAYLERRGVIDGIVTEDSDLLVFGCKTVLYKLDEEGYCDEVLHSRRVKCSSAGMHAFNDDTFRQMAILSGCDYLPSIPKLGLKTANEMLRKYGTVSKSLAAIAQKGLQIPQGYRLAFEKAEKTFVYQRVFDRNSEGLIRITTLSKASGSVDELDDCIGPAMSNEEAQGIANGDIDPISRQPIEDLADRRGGRLGDDSATTSTKSFYAQSRPKWMNSQKKKKGSTSASTALPGQTKLSGFFAKADTTQKPNTSRQVLASKDVNRVKTDLGLDKQQVKRRAVEDNVFEDVPPSGKSKFFAKSAVQETSPIKASEMSAQLAAFSSPSERVKRKRSDSAQSSDGGNISSPASVVLQEQSHDVCETPTRANEGAYVPSSPIPSPSFTLGSTSRPSQIPRAAGNEQTNGLFDQFRFEYDTAKPAAKPTTNESLMRTPLASISNTIAQTRQRAGSSRTMSSTGKRTLDINFEVDPFDEGEADLGNAFSSVYDTPTAAGMQQGLRVGSSRSLPSFAGSSAQSLSKRTVSYRPLRMGD